MLPESLHSNSVQRFPMGPTALHSLHVARERGSFWSPSVGSTNYPLKARVPVRKLEDFGTDSQKV